MTPDPLQDHPPGYLTRVLAPYLEDARVERMRAVLARRTRHLTAVLDRFFDPHNIAACVRSADACGVQDLHVVRSVATRAPQLGRAISMRAERWLTMTSYPSAELSLAALARYRVVVTSLDGATTPLDALPLDRPLAVVFGNEKDGVSEPLLAAAEHYVALPMRGFAQSLNVSVAFALVMDKLRTRLERSDVAWSLSEAEQVALLDRWIYRDVSQAPAILAELARRAGQVRRDGDP